MLCLWTKLLDPIFFFSGEDGALPPDPLHRPAQQPRQGPHGRHCASGRRLLRGWLPRVRLGAGVRGSRASGCWVSPWVWVDVALEYLACLSVRARSLP